jgi:hypothetical protein
MRLGFGQFIHPGLIEQEASLLSVISHQRTLFDRENSA